MLRKLGIIAVLSLIVTALAAVPALAQVTPTEVTRTGGLHFVGDPLLFDQGTSLRATGEVAGAGTQATATLTATATVTQGCLNRGGNEPRGLQETEQTVTASQTFETRQGRGTFDVATEPISAPTGGFTCPSQNMTPVLVDVTFTDITLTVTSQTGTTTATFPNQ